MRSSLPKLTSDDTDFLKTTLTLLNLAMLQKQESWAKARGWRHPRSAQKLRLLGDFLHLTELEHCKVAAKVFSASLPNYFFMIIQGKTQTRLNISTLKWKVATIKFSTFLCYYVVVFIIITQLHYYLAFMGNTEQNRQTWAAP